MKLSRITRAAGLTASVLLVTSCASYLEPKGVTTQLNADGQEELCMNIKLTGTNIPKRYCRTEAEWESMAANDQQLAREYFRQTDNRQGIVEQVFDGPY